MTQANIQVHDSSDTNELMTRQVTVTGTSQAVLRAEAMPFFLVPNQRKDSMDSINMLESGNNTEYGSNCGSDPPSLKLTCQFGNTVSQGTQQAAQQTDGISHGGGKQEYAQQAGSVDGSRQQQLHLHLQESLQQKGASPDVRSLVPHVYNAGDVGTFFTPRKHLGRIFGKN